MKAKPATKTASIARRAHKVTDHAQTKPALDATEEVAAAKADKPLTRAEKVVLRRLEAEIGSGLTSFVEIGNALTGINADRLYREESSTFESYCELKWDMGRQYGYRLMKAAECYEWLKLELPPGKPLPLNESQLRPLVDTLKPEQWVKAWKQVIAETAEMRLTAAAVEKVISTLGCKSKRSEAQVQKKARRPVPNGAVAKFIKVADKALRKEKSTVTELRAVLEKIRDGLRKLN